jgi:hypothetical protein
MGFALGVLRAGLLSVLAGCALPANTGISDWARGASVAVGLPTGPVRDDATQSMQQALTNYLFALALLADDGHFTFDEAGFAALVPRLEGQAAADVATLTASLREVAARPRPYWLPPSPSGPQAELNDRRPPMLIAAADPPVQRLLTALAAPADAGHAALLRDVAEGHALLAARVDRLTQRQTELLMRSALRHLRRDMAQLAPTPNALAPGQAIATVLPP